MPTAHTLTAAPGTAGLARFARNLCAAALGAASLAAQAGLIGDTVTVQATAGSYTTAAYTVVVGAGVEGNIEGSLPFDFSDLGFVLKSSLDATQVGANAGDAASLMLTGLDFGATLLDVVFDSPLTGMTRSFTGDSVTFNWLVQPHTPGDTLINARFVVADAGRLPEPLSAALVGAALLGAGWAGRRKLRR